MCFIVSYSTLTTLEVKAFEFLPYIFLFSIEKNAFKNLVTQSILGGNYLQPGAVSHLFVAHAEEDGEVFVLDLRVAGQEPADHSDLFSKSFGTLSSDHSDLFSKSFGTLSSDYSDQFSKSFGLSPLTIQTCFLRVLELSPLTIQTSFLRVLDSLL